MDFPGVHEVICIRKINIDRGGSHVMCYQPKITNIDRGEAMPILVFSGRYHIIYNASIVNNCFIM